MTAKKAHVVVAQVLEQEQHTAGSSASAKASTPPPHLKLSSTHPVNQTVVAAVEHAISSRQLAQPLAQLAEPVA